MAKLVVEKKDQVDCSLCGSTGKEGYAIYLKWWIITLKGAICQSCISRLFRGLHK